jgi:hypothetical protein
VHDALERIPPELSADIFDRGIILTGRRRDAEGSSTRAARGNRPAGAARGGSAVVGVLGAGKMLSEGDFNPAPSGFSLD